jgi:hypothetical protein
MFAGAVLLLGSHSPEVGVSLVLTHTLTTRPWPSRTVRVIVPVGLTVQLGRPCES